MKSVMPFDKGISPISIDKLRLLHIKYLGFDSIVHDGQLIALYACTPQILDIFEELFSMRFPLKKVSIMTHFYGNDSLSMADNNSSCHNLRSITGGNALSLHAYGTAIDINPINNPYVNLSCSESKGIVQYTPVSGVKFANRSTHRLGKSFRKGMSETVVDVFARHGFYRWGGYWDCPIDYQHFELSKSISELLAIMSRRDALEFMNITTSYYNQTATPLENTIQKELNNQTMHIAYKQDSEKFMKMARHFMKRTY